MRAEQTAHQQQCCSSPAKGGKLSTSTAILGHHATSAKLPFVLVTKTRNSVEMQHTQLWSLYRIAAVGVVRHPDRKGSPVNITTKSVCCCSVHVHDVLQPRYLISH